MHEVDRLLPEPERLRKVVRILAALDMIMCQEEWLRVHRYETGSSDGDGVGMIDNGAGDHLFVNFSKEGTLIKGFDHESLYSPYAQDEYGIWPGMYDGMPLSLLAYLDDEMFEKEDVTFCLWREPRDTVWKSGEFIRPDEWDDGKEFLLGYLYATPEAYTEWATYYYEKEINLEAVKRVYSEAAITAGTIVDLNSERNIEEVLQDLKNLGIATSDG